MASVKAGGPKPRRSRAELKELLLVTGLEVMAAQHLTDTDALTYKSVFDRLEQTDGIRVTHASVHERIWPSQRSFQLDVLRRAADSLPADTFLEETGAAALVLADADLETTTGRREAAQELIRVACNADITSTDFTLSVYRAIRSALVGLSATDPEREAIAQAIEETRSAIAERYVSLFEGLADALHMRVRPELGVDRQTALLWLFNQVVALADGFRIEQTDAHMINLPTGPGGAMRQWHLYSWSVWGAVQTLIELDGDLTDAERRL